MGNRLAYRAVPQSGLFGRIGEALSDLVRGRKSQVLGMVSTMYKGQGGLFSKGLSYKEATERGYNKIVWVQRCIKIIGESVGSVPWKAYQSEGYDESRPLPDHPLEKLLQHPNPYMSGSEFFQAWATHLSLSGNSYWEIVKAGNLPKHLYPIRPDWITPVPDPVTFISGYKFAPGGSTRPIILEPSDIIHFKYLDPLNEYVGISPLAAASRTIDTENSAVSWNKSIFDNSAVPGGILSVPASLLDRQEREAIEEDLEEQFSKDNMNRPLVLWGGMEWERMSMSQKDMDFMNQRNLNKYELCAILGVLPQLVGANEDPTYSNYSVARTSFWEDRVIPMLDWIKSKINTVIAPQFGDDVIISYDLSRVPAMQDAFRNKVEAAHKLFTMGWPINAINNRLALGFDPVPWGNSWWAPMNLIPVASEGSGIPPAQEDQPLAPVPFTEEPAGPEARRPEDQVQNRPGAVGEVEDEN